MESPTSSCSRRAKLAHPSLHHPYKRWPLTSLHGVHSTGTNRKPTSSPWSFHGITFGEEAGVSGTASDVEHGVALSSQPTALGDEHRSTAAPPVLLVLEDGFCLLSQGRHKICGPISACIWQNDKLTRSDDPSSSAPSPPPPPPPPAQARKQII
ncbi:hypothetical protein KP509_04G034900 [Ceratopteris richardii]|uniref:Uncharacterized protein n=1 Tax=Ceratopteris richardii TaxID=49495 RepID=A0A8T2UW07_CERRI|nr:hypothetical protein KP509_04G034900 [Ceratopteris richardii]